MAEWVVLVSVAVRIVVELRAGPGARAYCDGDPGQAPILVVSDGSAEVLLLSPVSDHPCAVDVAVADELSRALDVYRARLRVLAVG